MNLPLDITIDAGVQHVVDTPQGITIASKALPVIDSDGWYLKKGDL